MDRENLHLKGASISDVSPMSSLAIELKEASISNLRTKFNNKIFAQSECSDHIFKSPPKRSVLYAEVSAKNGQLMKTKLNTPTSSGRFYPRRLLSEGSPPPDENNPPPNTVSPSKYTPVKPYSRSRVPLEDQDPNSQDSGYAVSEDSKSPASFRFAEPSGFAPRRLNTMESPRRNLLMSSYASSESNHSPCSIESADDSFLELFQGEKMEENGQLPSGLGKLLSGPILGNREDEENRTTPVMKRPCRQLRRCMSENNYSPVMSVRRTLINNNNNSPDEVFSLKRPLARPCVPFNKRQRPLVDHTTAYNNNNNIEKTKGGTLFQYGFTKTKPSPQVISAQSPPRKQRLFHSLSDSGMSIKMALQRSTQEELIGDLTRPFALPLTSGKHEDLKAISCETLGKLINGEYDNMIGSFRIIDCRYPYEYEGGHIKGAINLFTEDQIKTELVENRLKKPQQPESNQSLDDSEKRHILIFHCEFSSERGPKLSRYLRKEDRNENSYPNLHYPELYLLHGGYSSFFQTHSHLCEPRSYKPMYDPAHTSEFKHFRAKSKTWAGSNKRAAVKGLARLGF